MLKRLKLLIITIVFSIVLYTPYLSANEKYTANECFEKFSRGTLKFNQGIDKAILKPIAKGYRVLQAPIRSGTSNFVNNLRSLSQGRANYTMQFDHYEEVPSNVAEEVKAKLA